MSSLIKNVIFDLDGTVIDSFGDVADCLKHAYSMSGVTADIITRVDMGPPLREMVKKITPDISDEKLGKVIGNFRFLYDNSAFFKTAVYDGMQDLLKELKNSRRGLFMITNKSAIPTKRIMDLLGLNYFQDIVCPDASESDKKTMLSAMIKKWDLKRQKTVMVGDGVSDIAAAKESGIHSVGVLWGYSDKASLAGASPDFMAADINSLRNILFQAK